MRSVRGSSFLWFFLVACGTGPESDRLAHSSQAAGAYLGGLDIAGALTASEAQSYQSQHGISWSGAYVGGACNGGSGWTKAALTSIAQATGWSFMPIYVGQQASSICSSSTLTAAQGTLDGNDAVSIMAQYAWIPDAGIPVCLDLEGGTYSADPSASQAYVTAWANAVHAGGYSAYMYSGTPAINAFATAGVPIDAVWIADWTYANNTFVSDLSPYDVTSVTAYTNHNRAWQYCSGTVDSDTSDLVLAPAPGTVNPPSPTLTQVSANDAVTVLNWPDGHAEAFFTTPGAQLMHLATNGTSETWTTSASLASGASCGSSSIFWPSPWLYAEAFSPLADGGTGHLWETGGTWNTYQAFGGTALAHLQTVTWQDGHTEVFALGADGAVWHQWWNLTTSAWTGWQSLGGTFAVGPSAIIWGDGHGEVFATSASGAVSHASTSAGAWSSWASISGSLTSRPVPVRTPNGSVSLYGVGTDGHLYQATYSNGWSAFAAVETDVLVGEPSAVANADGSVEVFARDATGVVVVAHSGSPWSAIQPLGASQVSASDPFAWTRSDGTVDVFAVDGNGNLLSIHRDTTGAWGTWALLSGGAAACAVPVTVPDGGSGTDAGLVTDAGSHGGSDAGTQSGSDAGAASDGGARGPDGGTTGGQVSGRSGCSCGAAAEVPALPWSLLAAWGALLALRRGARAHRRSVA